MRGWGVTMGLLGLMLVAQPRAAESRPAEPQPRLAGEWTLQPDKSDDGQAALDAIGAERHKRGWQRGPLAGGLGPGLPGAGFGSNRLTPEEERSLDEALETIRRAPASLTITQVEGEISISADGRLRQLYPDGRKVTNGVGPVECRTRWRKADLVTETRIGQAKIIETIRLQEDKVLLIELRCEVSMFEKPVIVRRVYGRAGA